MTPMDNVYARVIYDLFGVRLCSREEIDEFYASLEEKLKIDEINKLQVAIQDSLKSPCCCDAGSSLNNNEGTAAVVKLPSLSDSKEITADSLMPSGGDG